MQFTVLTVALFASLALAAPGKPDKHPKPTNTPPVQQTNSCGNGAAPYCCDTDGSGKYTTCKDISQGGTCSATTVCCNANNSIQVCLGNAVIVVE